MARNSTALFGPDPYLRIPIGRRWVEVEKVPEFDYALVENLLRVTKGWRDAHRPLAYIAKQTRRLAWERAIKDVPLQEEYFYSTAEREISSEDVLTAPLPSYSLSQIRMNDPPAAICFRASRRIEALAGM